MINICAFVQAVVVEVTDGVFDGMPVTSSFNIGIIVNTPVKMIECFVVVSSILIICYMMVGKTGKMSHEKMPPSPYRLPILGNIHYLLKEKLPLHLVFHSLIARFGSVFTFWIGKGPIVMINDFELAKQVLFNKSFSGRPQRTAGQLTSRGFQGIIVTDFCPALKLRRKLGRKNWRWQSEDRLQKIVKTECEHLKVTLEKKLAQSDDQVINISTEIWLACANTTWSLLFGKRVESDDPDFLQFMKMKDWLLQGLLYSTLSHGFPFLKGLPVNKLQYLQYYKKACDELIGKYYSEHIKTFDKDNIRDMLDALLLEHEHLTKDNVEMIVSDFLIAGVETVASTLEFIILHLLQYKDCADKCLSEINDIVGENELTLDVLSKLHYTNAVVAETLRLKPTAPLTPPHKATEDTTILDYTIPKDTIVQVNIYAIHIDSKLHQEPMRFKPERFLDEEGHYQNIEGYLPFSLGRRECLGKAVALKSLVFFTAEILRNFSLDIPDGHRLSEEVICATTMSPKAYSILMKRRK